ncbi:MAG: hypothetical protein R3F20_07635 [Planctomycetota bacterium]
MTTSPDRDEILSRIVDRRATPDDWTATDGWEDGALAATLLPRLRDDAALRGLGAELERRAASVVLPIAPRRRRGFVRAAAAVILLVAGFGLGRLGSSRPAPATPDADVGPPATAADHFARYLDRGQSEGLVIESLPSLVLEARWNDDRGRMELVTLRQVVERRDADGVLAETRTEDGEPAVRTLDTVALRGAQSF